MSYSDELRKARQQKSSIGVSNKSNNVERKKLNIGKGKLSQYTRNDVGRPINEGTDIQGTDIGTGKDK